MRKINEILSVVNYSLHFILSFLPSIFYQHSFFMKEKILFAIFNHFDAWSSHLSFTCQKGCSLCCTQNVTITSLEGGLIRQFLSKKHNTKLKEILANTKPAPPAKLTANGFTTSCLSGSENQDEEDKNFSPCPFLVDDCCSIYIVRPFSCRCFGSFERCTPNKPAILPEYYLSASTAVMQVLEHLDLNGSWGPLLNVLRELESNHPHHDARSAGHTLQPVPLPGFLMPESEKEKVQEFLTSLFSIVVDGKSLEQILDI
jgi:Fe-S-cluster containining protein